MTIQNFAHNQTIRDGGLNLIGVGDASMHILVGTSSLGTAGSFYSYQGTDVQTVFDQLGEGPLPHSIAKHLLRSDGAPTMGYKSTATNAGTSSAITRSNGTSGPLITLGGAPFDQYDMIVVMVLGGAVATATFKYSMDGGDTYSDTLVTAGTYLLPSNVTITFPAGTYVAGETYSWTDTAPSMNGTDIGTACDAIIVSAYDPRIVHILGQPADAAALLTIAAIAATKRASAWAAKKYLRIALEAPAVDKATLISAFAAFADIGVIITAGFCEMVNDKTSQIQKRADGRVIIPRIARNPVEVLAIRNTTDSNIDPLPDVSKLVPDGAAASTGYHDEGKTPGLLAARFSTLTTIVAVPGFYTTPVVTMAGPSSDFQLDAYLAILLEVCRVWYQYGVKNLGRRIKRDVTTGYIDTAFAESIEDDGAQVIRAALNNAIEEAQVIVNRTDNTLLDPTLRAKVRVVIGGYIIVFDSEIGLADTIPAEAA